MMYVWAVYSNPADKPETESSDFYCFYDKQEADKYSDMIGAETEEWLLLYRFEFTESLFFDTAEEAMQARDKAVW